MLTLASKSPRRSELLKQIISDFEVLPANIDENIKIDNIELLPETLSKLKANAIYGEKHPYILAADTVVILDDKVLGKPHSLEEAVKMLTSLSGREHKVITGYTIKTPTIQISNSVVTKVFFNKLDKKTIEDYIATGSPFDKAGAYGIQDKEFNLVNHIEGSYTNVMGLPVEALKEEFSKLKLDD